MNYTPLIMLLAISFAIGCSDTRSSSVVSDGDRHQPDASTPQSSYGSVEDSGSVNAPVVFGFTSELMEEMHKLVASSDPTANAQQIVNDYVGELKLAAKSAGIAPNDNGDYILPQNVSEAMNKPRTEFDVVDDLAEELALDLPPWSHQLITEYNADNITKPRKELLFIVVFAKAIPLMGQAAR